VTRQARTGATLRDQQRRFTRQLLMDAAESVLAEKGYVATTIEDIASSAGTSRATFYLHFSSKNELVQALFERAGAAGVERYRALDEILPQSGQEARTAMRAWLHGWLDIWRDRARVFRGMMEAAAADPELARRQIEISPAFIDALEHAPWRTGRGHPSMSRERALMLEIMTQRLFLVVSSELLTLPDDLVLDFLTDLWWDVFHGPST
jgi:AcrR family transcriptional regulator